MQALKGLYLAAHIKNIITETRGPDKTEWSLHIDFVSSTYEPNQPAETSCTACICQKILNKTLLVTFVVSADKPFKLICLDLFFKSSKCPSCFASYRIHSMLQEPLRNSSHSNLRFH